MLLATLNFFCRFRAAVIADITATTLGAETRRSVEFAHKFLDKPQRLENDMIALLLDMAETEGLLLRIFETVAKHRLLMFRANCESL